MKAILFGLTGFGNAALRSLLEQKVELAAVVTRREDGPYPYFLEKNLAEECRERGIPVFESPDLRRKEFIEQIQQIGADILLCATFHERLPKMLYRAAPIALNIHPSLLPQYRGATPTNWAIAFGEKETGVTAHLLTAKTDSGALLLQKKMPIESRDTDGDLRRKLCALTAGMVSELLEYFLEHRKLEGIPQDEKKATYFPRFTQRDAFISFDEPAAQILNRIRAATPYPGAYTFLSGEKLEIETASVLGEKSSGLKPGLILKRSGKNFAVQTKDEIVEVLFKNIPQSTDAAFLGIEKDEITESPDEIKSRIAHTRESYGMEADAEIFPKMVVVSVAYPCNAQCPNCPYTESNSDLRLHYQDAPFIEPEVFKKIARECGEYQSYVRITGGGEPLLHPADMIAHIEYAKAARARVWLNTNGSLLTPEKGIRLLAAGTDMIEFSVDASDEKTYSVVRAGLDFKTLVHHVTSILAARNKMGAPTLIAVSVINQDLVKDQMPQITAFWKNLGVDEVIKRKFLTWGSNTTLDALHSADETAYLNKDAAVPCPFPFHRLNIDSRGKIEVCGYDISGRTNFGNVKTQSIREIWTGPQFSWWRTMHAARRGGEIPLCRECPDWKYRSWKHNWEKVIKTAKASRKEARDPEFENQAVGS